MASLLRTDKEITESYHRNVDTVYRICYSFMKNKTEAEDMVQETFLRLISAGKTFQNLRHEKAWLIVTASNLCKDQLKRFYRTDEDLDAHTELAGETDVPDNPVLEAILRLEENYKTVVYLYYYEGYSTAEIAKYIRCPQATVRTRLSRARNQLKSMLGGESE